MPPPPPVRTNRSGTPYRSPTPNAPENDPFLRSPAMSPNTMAAKQRLKKHLENAASRKRAEGYSKKFLNFLSQNNNNTNHVFTNDKNFNTKLKDIKNPVYLLSDVMHGTNSRVRHVYARDYLEKTFKNKTIHRSPMTGVPTSPALMRAYTNRTKNVNVSAFQKEKKELIQFFGKYVYEESLQMDHMLIGFRTYHLVFMRTIAKYHKDYNAFLKAKLPHAIEFFRAVPKLTSIARISYRDIQKLSYIMKGMTQIPQDFKGLPLMYELACARILFVLPQSIFNSARRIYKPEIVALRQSGIAPGVDHVYNVLSRRA